VGGKTSLALKKSDSNKEREGEKAGAKQGGSDGGKKCGSWEGTRGLGICVRGRKKVSEKKSWRGEEKRQGAQGGKGSIKNRAARLIIGDSIAAGPEKGTP